MPDVSEIPPLAARSCTFSEEILDLPKVGRCRTFIVVGVALCKHDIGDWCAGLLRELAEAVLCGLMGTKWTRDSHGVLKYGGRGGGGGAMENSGSNNQQVENVDYPKLIWEDLAYQINHMKEKRLSSENMPFLDLPRLEFVRIAEAKVSQRKKIADDSQETVDVSKESGPKLESVKRKTSNKRRVKKKVTLSADDNKFLMDPNSAWRFVMLSLEGRHNSDKLESSSLRLNWNNLKGDHYPFDLSKPLPLQGHPGHLIIAADYFFNNDLEYLKSSDLERTYTTSIMKTKAARYEIKVIEDMVPTLWSPTKVGYDKDALKGIKHLG
ncbi:hypothetical protein Tco_0636900 [Tanacetum coccineum]